MAGRSSHRLANGPLIVLIETFRPLLLAEQELLPSGFSYPATCPPKYSDYQTIQKQFHQASNAIISAILSASRSSTDSMTQIDTIADSVGGWQEPLSLEILWSLHSILVLMQEYSKVGNNDNQSMLRTLFESADEASEAHSGASMRSSGIDLLVMAIVTERAPMVPMTISVYGTQELYAGTIFVPLPTT